MKKPLFIDFEGIDGCGKSTQAVLLHQYFNQNQISNYLTNEPTKGDIGKFIRNILSGNNPKSEYIIASLFAADRLDHILNTENGLLMQIHNGNHVICDRYYFSSLAYHGVSIDMEWVWDLNKKAQILLKPDFTFFIELDPIIAYDRIKESRTQIEIYETLENLKQVNQMYYKAFEMLKNQEHVVFINGNQSIDDIHLDILKHLNFFLEIN